MVVIRRPAAEAARTRSALSLLAGVLGAGESEAFAEHPQEALVDTAVDHRVVRAVDVQYVRVDGHRFSSPKQRIRARRARTPRA